MAIRKSVISGMRFVADNPYVNLTAGGILIYTAVHEIIHSTEEAGIGAHHGVLAFGLVHALGAMPEILHGFDEIIKAHEEEGDDQQEAPEK